MKNSKLQIIEIGKYEEMFTYCVLSPEINGVEYVRKLNESAKEFNKDVELFNIKQREFRELFGGNLSCFEVTGFEYLNEREPKYPPTKPKGFKNIQEACPEITNERERRRALNVKHELIFKEHSKIAGEKLEKAIEPIKNELIAKYPQFKMWVNSYSWSRKIYDEFKLSSVKYITDDLT